ncbi:hypothetical protein [Psychroserpens sp.]|nr:hypothetical protein [Psychroserpens sp.]MBO6606604.1 hypothetical protein [Psychroserpens sp.]MBO6632210.1 hypothetical protein [Psychroserpens sp.]MBO6653308.1 hypothetical protein [Psychroserpens sp.]MBO6680665.1 hypothetical protein [Psychroserpens sp.]MBO6750377.1 hypothetical protein [Psychroserpens sp.]
MDVSLARITTIFSIAILITIALIIFGSYKYLTLKKRHKALEEQLNKTT